MECQLWTSSHPSTSGVVKFTATRNVWWPWINFKNISAVVVFYKDEFQFKYTPTLGKNTAKFTMRTVLSDISKLYYPLGFVSPIIVRWKMFLQEMWKLNFTWDELLPIQQDFCNQYKLESVCELLTIDYPKITLTVNFKIIK